jgi:thymidylate synthase
MKSYIALLNHILENGKDRTDRTGVGTRAVFGHQFRHDLADGFPLLTTKKVWWKGVVAELLWFLDGDTNVNTLKAQDVHIWDEWCDADGNLGPVYGYQWRNWEGNLDQISQLVKQIIATPDSRRHIVTAWNPSDVPKMKLPPCHPFWQCQVDGDRLHLSLYMRSCDAFLGLPFNIASYALLLSMLARTTSLKPGQLIISFGDLHIYKNHFEAVQTQLEREPKFLPALVIADGDRGLFTLRPEDLKIVGYDPHPAIKAPIAV